jgi:hypothetical protein
MVVVADFAKVIFRNGDEDHSAKPQDGRRWRWRCNARGDAGSVLETIILAVCLISSPTTCKEVQINVTPDYGASLQLPMYCARHGQLEAQKWIAEHPTWRIEKWACYPNGKVRLKV